MKKPIPTILPTGNKIYTLQPIQRKLLMLFVDKLNRNEITGSGLIYSSTECRIVLRHVLKNNQYYEGDRSVLEDIRENYSWLLNEAH